MSLRLLHRPHVLLVGFPVTVLADFPLVEESGTGRCVLNLLAVSGIVIRPRSTCKPIRITARRRARR